MRWINWCKENINCFCQKRCNYQIASFEKQLYVFFTSIALSHYFMHKRYSY